MPSTIKRIKIAALAGALVASLCGSSPFVLPGRGQVTTAPPIKTRIKIKKQKQKHESFTGDVINFTPAAVTVRARHNLALLRTFSFSPELARKAENRHMEPGERITVRYIKGTDTAVSIKGKLRKPQGPLVPLPLTRPGR